MKNQDVINLFKEGKSGKTKHLTSTGTKLINYSTIIAWKHGDKVYLNKNKYSSTTSRIQGMIKNTIQDLIEVEV